MAIRFFFEYEKTIIQLPVNPESITISIPGRNEKSEIVKLGEINILKSIGLREITIESFLPSNASGSYVLTSGAFKKPSFYMKFFNTARNDKQPMRLIITDLGVNMLVSIENLTWEMVAQDDDTHYTLELKQYRRYESKELKVNATTKKATKSKNGSTSRQKTGFAIGDTVVVNGNYWYDSYGSDPHGTFKNYTGKISHIVADKSRKYRYHITTPDGGYRGWVNESQMKQS